MCMMCSYNPVCAVDGTHKTVIETGNLAANTTFSDVTFSTIPGDTSTGETISAGQTIQETLETAGDRDWFKIELQAGDRITFELDGVNHNGSSLDALEDPFVRLYSSTGSYVTGDDDGGPGRNSNLTFTIQNSGTYFIEAAAWDDRYAGDYELSVSTAAPLAPGTLTELSEFLVSGYWSTPRYWNLGSTGLNAQNGVLTYTLDGFSEDSNGLTAERANLVREAFKMYEAILGIDFQETSSTTADFRFKDNDSGAYAGSSYGFSGGEGFISSSRINIATSWSGGSSAYDSYTFQTILHEIGHALGLGHQGGYNGSASYPNSADFENDSWQGSMMSYFSQSENNSISATNAILISPMTVDWLALDDHYGKYGFGVSNAFTGDTVWGFNTNIAASTSQVFHDLALYADDRAFTVIDSGGIDTLDFSGYSQNQRIDLTVSQANAIKATTSDIGNEKENLSLAVGTVIENAKSGSGNDQLIGNQVANSLYGGAGNDTLEGKGGNDFLDGGAGLSDVALFSSSSSQYEISQASNGQFMISHISGSRDDGTDTLANVELARFSDNDVDLTTWVPTGPPVIDGTNGNEIITGTADDEVINGLGGDDWLRGSNGHDTIDGGAGSDTIDGGSGNDVVIYDSADDPSKVSGGRGRDTLLFDGAAPTSFDLVAGSFEGAMGRDTDSSGEAWDVRTTVFNDQWRIKQTLTDNDDGSSVDVFYDVDGSEHWFLDELRFDASDTLFFRRQRMDNGERHDFRYDLAGDQDWSEYYNQYNSSNVLTHRHFTLDNGGRTVIQFDYLSMNSWSQISDTFDTFNNRITREYTYDSGERTNYTYDPLDVANWTLIEDRYNTSNDLYFTRERLESGGRIDRRYDVDDNRDWSEYSNTYDASGKLTLREVIMDSGAVENQTFNEDISTWDV